MNENEIWDINDVATYLKMPVSGVRELCRTRSQQRMEVPLPVLRIHSKAIRFRKSEVIQWVNSLGTGAA